MANRIKRLRGDHGSLIETLLARVTELFWSHVDKAGDCWIWTGTMSSYGYGRFNLYNKNFQAHRIAWELTNGPIPKGLHILHACDNPSCVRPEHLSAGTQLDNIRDMQRKGRDRKASGEEHGFAKLNWEKVREVRARYAAGDVTMRSLAAEYGVKHSTILLVVNGKTWRENLVTH